MRRVLLDINIVVDALCDRPPFSEPAKALMAKARAGEFQICLVATTPTTFFSLARKVLGTDRARDVLGDLLRTCTILAVDQSTLLAAFERSMPDFEDAVQDAAAENAGIEIIVTRDPKGFVGSTRRILDAETMIEELDGAPGE